MLRSLTTLLALLVSATLVAGPATPAGMMTFSSGTRQNTLIELYTSQGCSSCPPAERWLGALQEDPRLWQTIVPLAFHVDYWDYLGWKDAYARPAFSERQRRYHREKAVSTVYTPGFVVNGREWRRWFGLQAIPISKRQSGVLTVTLSERELEASFQPALTARQPLILNVVLLGVGLTAQISRGENAGKELAQDFVVLQHLQLRSSDGHWSTRRPQADLEPGARMAIAAWISRPDSQAPLQATGGWLPRQTWPLEK